MDLIKALAKVLEGSGASRIHAVADILKNGGVTTADDLKYFYWTSLKDLGGLSNMEVNKIMRYVQEKFPEEYEEYKRKRNEERKLQNEVEILNFKAEHEKKLQQVKMKFDEEMEKRLKEQQEMEEQLKCTQEQSETSKGKLSSWAKKPMECWNDFKKWATISETGDDKDMTIEQAVSKIFGENSPVIEPVTCFLKSQKIAKAKDMSNLDWETLKCCEEWTIFGLEKIKEFVEKNFPKDYKKQKQTRNRKISCSEFQTEEEILKCDDGLLKMKDSLQMTIEEAVMKIFRDSESTTINHVISAMKNCGIMMAIELKYFERDLLEDMGLVDKEINKIMAFVQKNMDLSKALAKILEGSSVQRINKVTTLLKKEGAVSADDLIYFDRKDLKELGDLSTMEINLIMEYIQENICETDATVWNSLPEVKMKFDEEVEKRLKEQQEMEEQLKRTQEQSETSKGKLRNS